MKIVEIFFPSRYMCLVKKSHKIIASKELQRI